MAFLWLDDVEDDPGFPMNTNLEPMSPAAIANAQDYIRRQVHSLTKGLLELVVLEDKTGPLFSHTVRFLHRTVADFLKSEPRLDHLQRNHGKRTNSSLSDTVGRLRLAEYYQCGLSHKHGYDSLESIDGFMWSTFKGIGAELSPHVVDAFQNALTVWNHSNPGEGLENNKTAERSGSSTELGRDVYRVSPVFGNPRIHLYIHGAGKVVATLYGRSREQTLRDGPH